MVYNIRFPVMGKPNFSKSNIRVVLITVKVFDVTLIMYNNYHNITAEIHFNF